MRFVFGKQDMTCLEQAREHCFLLTNGLGGYASITAAFSASRRDHSLLMAAVTAPTVRVNMVHRLQECLEADGDSVFLSTQEFAGGSPPEEGFLHLSSFVWEDGPVWMYHVRGVQVRRRCAMEYGSNTTAVVYEVENRSGRLCTLRVRESFAQAFWMADKGYLKDVISGTAADEQLRCNQIWAVSMPFTVLAPEQERQVVDTVFRRLYTPCGLRALAPDDAEFHPVYAGLQRERDMAYHQGTVWPFPLGAYYLAYLKVHGNSPAAARTVREQLAPWRASSGRAA